MLNHPPLPGSGGGRWRDDVVVASNGLGDPTEVQRVTVGTIDLGGARFEEVPVAVSAGFDELSAIHGRRIDGALGFPLFQELFLGLDFPNRRLLIGREWPAGLPAVRASLPLRMHADVPFVQVQIQGRPVELLIDTGANQALHLSGALAASLQWKVEPRVGSLVAAFGEVGRERIGRLAGSLALAGVEQIEPTAVISGGPPSLGLRALESFCVVFHPADARVWLCGPDVAPVGPVPERSLGLSLYVASGGWRVAGVIPGSPADDAQLAVGNLVTQLEGRPARSWTRDQMQQWLDAHADMALVVADAVGERALTLPVWDLVP